MHKEKSKIYSKAKTKILKCVVEFAAKISSFTHTTVHGKYSAQTEWMKKTDFYETNQLYFHSCFFKMKKNPKIQSSWDITPCENKKIFDRARRRAKIDLQ